MGTLNFAQTPLSTDTLKHKSRDQIPQSLYSSGDSNKFSQILVTQVFKEQQKQLRINLLGGGVLPPDRHNLLICCCSGFAGVWVRCRMEVDNAWGLATPLSAVGDEKEVAKEHSNCC